MQLFKPKSESVGFLSMNTHKDSVVTLPQSYSYFDKRSEII